MVDSTRALELGDETVGALLDCLGDGIARCRGDRIVFANAALAQLLGVDAATSTPEKAPPSAAPAIPAAKPEPAPTTGLPVRDLSVREERGQTFLHLKLAQPVTQYRHFTLPQPSRIVLDILDDLKLPAASELFRVDTGTVDEPLVPDAAAVRHDALRGQQERNAVPRSRSLARCDGLFADADRHQVRRDRDP